MRIGITEYRAEHVAAVRAFNGRLAGTKWAEFAFPEEPAAGAFVALEDGVMRGGYLLNRQRFCFGGVVREVAHYRLPISEGVLNRAYVGVGMQLLRDALKTEPLLFGLGMGGMDRPLPRMLAAVGWKLYEVPFAFRVEHAGAFLREMRPLGALSDVARVTRAGWAAIRAVQAWRGRGRVRAEAEPAADFGGWADEIWERAKGRYAMLAVRDGAALETLYPRSDARFVRLRVSRGWAVVLDTQMHGHRHFGNLRVGTIVDALADPEDAGAVAAAAAAHLKSRGVDLIISNQAHQAWAGALDSAGFLRGPSNFVFAASPKLAELLAPFEAKAREIHINRGDGDGPIHL